MDQTLRFLQQENTRLLAEGKQLRDELMVLREYLHELQRLEMAANQLTSEKELVPLLDKILYYALTLLDAEDGSIALVDEEKNQLVFAVVRGAIQSQLVNYRMPRNEGITGWVVSHGQPAIINDVRQDPHFSPNVDRLFDFETKSMLCVPMRVGGRILGAIALINRHSGQDFGEIDQNLLSLLAWIAAIALSKFED